MKPERQYDLQDRLFDYAVRIIKLSVEGLKKILEDDRLSLDNYADEEQLYVLGAG